MCYYGVEVQTFKPHDEHKKAMVEIKASRLFFPIKIPNLGGFLFINIKHHYQLQKDFFLL
jgi:hypothetical protein